jgi:hypothetical protein
MLTTDCILSHTDISMTPRMAEKEYKMKEQAKDRTTNVYIWIYIYVVQTSFLNDMNGGGWNPLHTLSLSRSTCFVYINVDEFRATHRCFARMTIYTANNDYYT